MMKHGKILIASLVAASLVAPVAYAKVAFVAKAPAASASGSSSNANSNANSSASSNANSNASSNASSNSQAGGLPATNQRVAALEAAVVNLNAALAAEVAARRAADAALANQIAAETAARIAADATLANEIAAIPQVFAGEGAADNIHGATATVATKTVPAGSYFVLAAVRMVNGQSAGNANARCVLSADGNALVDTSDLEFPILNTTGGALGSTMFAPLHATYSSAAPITIRVDCTEDKGVDGSGLNAFAQIMALKAGTTVQ